MLLQINQGLAKFELIDYYANLGLPIGATATEIRKRFLMIARALHPDSREGDNKQYATQLLSRLVNPAYEKLSIEKERNEFAIILRLLGQRIVSERAAIDLETELAKELSKAADWEGFYQQCVQKLATTQYQDLAQVIRITGQLSELNLVYVFRKEGGNSTTQFTPAVATPGIANSPPLNTAAAKATVPPKATHPGVTHSTPPTGNNAAQESSPIENYVSQYCRRAQDFMDRGNFQSAIQELRDALKLVPQDSRCHTLLGNIYLKQKQLTMAKVHFTQALKSDPQNVAAIQGKEELTKLEQKAQKAKAKQTIPPKPDKGLFGLFGGKKK